ncbi:MAG: NADH-quinone oxidoreductase subunit G [Micrococcales bacterium]|nr:NADH-quinone oxidoreductase subunit G [Micrococcales bacterium]MCL2666575.1 NADH-quinone oxidoreductase subunit G [Micrococcales bacterium]
MTTAPTTPRAGVPLVPAAPVVDAPAPADTVTLTVDGLEITVPKGTLVIRAAEQLGIAIPRFCDHPLLAPVGACRQCMVEVWAPGRDGNLAKMPKPQPSCAIECTNGMQVRTQHTSDEADTAQRAVMELILANHPLDCPICDKGGECPLQNQAVSNGRSDSRLLGGKRDYEKPVNVSAQILLDRERCVLCQRCTRFCEQVAGDKFVDLQMRGARQQIGGFDTRLLDFAGQAPVASADATGGEFASYFSGNTVQICPVGALTSASYRFRSRPFDLVSTPSVAEHDAMGSAIRIDHRRGKVLRRLAGDDQQVNTEWLTDKDRFAFRWQDAEDRITTPMVRRDGQLVAVSWLEALETAAEGLRKAMGSGGVGVLPGGRLTLEDAYAYSKFARVVLGTNDIDHRARVVSDEETAFLANQVAGSPMDVTFTDLVAAPHVVLVGFEPEDEGGIFFLRLREKVRAGSMTVTQVAAAASPGARRLSATLVPAAPGTEAELLDGAVAGADNPALALLAERAAADGAVIVVGERLAGSPGALSAAVRLARRSGALLAWVPRRAGERGAVEAGTLPNLLPGGRPAGEGEAWDEMAEVWGATNAPQRAGRPVNEILVAAWGSELGGLLVGGVDPGDLPDPAAVRNALDEVGFLVSLEVRHSQVTARADVVLPVAPPAEKPGTFVNWEGRPRPFAQALVSTQASDHRVLDRLATAMGCRLGLATLTAVHDELDRLGGWRGAKVAAPDVPAPTPPTVAAGHAVLASWRLLLDAGRGQDGEDFLARTARSTTAWVSAATAAALGDPEEVKVSTERGCVTVPVEVVDMADHVVWLPTNARDCQVYENLVAVAGDVVEIAGSDEEVQV